MRLKNILLAGAMAVGLAAATGPSPAVARDWPVTPDPHVWLDEIEGERALAWARAENERTLGALQADPRYQGFYDQALEILQARDRIPSVSIRPDGLYNFWQDETHVRGIWRRTDMASYRTDAPRWDVILDVDALAKAENANWVFQGATCLPPELMRCLISLSDGGKDANIVREFDVATKSFVAGGFELPEGKQSFTWIDRDTLLVARDWGPGTMTPSEYPFVVKRLRRGQPWQSAEEVYRGRPEDVRADPWVVRDNEGTVHAVGAARGVDFFSREFVLLTKNGPVVLPMPGRASPGGIVNGRLLMSLREPWEAAPGLSFTTGSLVSYDLEEWKRDPKGARPSLVWAPGERQTLSGYSTTRDRLILTTLENVRGRAYSYRHAGGRWQVEPIELPANATLNVATTSNHDDEAMFTVTDFLTPTTLYHFDGSRGRLETLKSTPARFDATGLTVDQHQATSADGTRIPYFVIRPEKMAMDGSTPTILYGYGGFQISQVPSYNGPLGRLWLQQGNAYVVANLRGGGEFGPEWHQSAQGANKQRTWDDFIAVAEDLVKRGISSPRRLAVSGGSQGGLLVGTAITQRPELFNAAIVRVPLFDMLSYHRLLAGASWVGEYGNPDIPEQRKWIEAYSPYQRLTAGRDYPTPFILTSTKDDRVHPGHARRAAARLAEIGQPYYYYENIDGGHSAAANLRETARRMALEYVYTSRRLVD